MTRNRASTSRSRQASDRGLIRLPFALLRRLALGLCLALAGQGSFAQEGPAPEGPEAQPPVPLVLTLDQRRLFLESAWGKALKTRSDGEEAELIAENRRIEDALQKEEQELTDRRAKVPAADFTRLADEFDARVEGIRSAQEAKVRSLSAKRETEERAFFAAAGPVLKSLLAESGAAAILASGAVIVSSEAIDITDAAIKQMDAAYPGLPADETNPIPQPAP